MINLHHAAQATDLPTFIPFSVFQNILGISRYTDFDLYSYFYGLVTQVPEGHVTSFGDLARALGDVRAARACAYMIAGNRCPDTVPSFRVTYSDGSLFKHDSGKLQAAKLRDEGIAITAGKVEKFENKRFTDFKSEYPLAEMQKEQLLLRGMVTDLSLKASDSVCAVDVAYTGSRGIGSCVWVADGTLKRKSVQMPVKFPYIPGYLSYREFPFIKELCSEFDGIILIDGNGQLHYRGMGLATFAGVLLEKTTIGVAKSLLTGRKSGSYVMIDGRRTGYIMGKREIISAGNGISLEESISFIRSRYGCSYPRILKEADRSCKVLSKAMKRASES